MFLFNLAFLSSLFFSFKIFAQTSLPTDVKKIFEDRCVECHNSKDLDGGLDLLNMDLLFKGAGESGKPTINLINPEASYLFELVKNKKMPKGNRKKLDDAELQSVLNWIKAEASARASKTEEVLSGFETDTAVENAILDDLKNRSTSDAKDIRYFTLTNIINRSKPRLTVKQLKTYEFAISKAINSLSWKPQIIHLEAIAGVRGVYRIYLSQLGWTADQWENLVGAYPYGILYDTFRSKAIREATQSRLPYIRADWFAARGLKPPLYHMMLDLPDTVLKLESILNVDSAKNFAENKIARSGFRGGDFPGGSGVADHNRLIEVHRQRFGFYWKSYDFATSEGRKDLLNNPIGPGEGKHAFKEDGGEFIFNLPNGLQGYLIADANGKRIDSAPEVVVRDKTNQSRAVINGLSCIVCHADGMNRTDDQVRQHVTESPEFFDAVTIQKVKAIYPAKSEMDNWFDESDKLFQGAIEKIGSRPAGSEAVGQLTKEFEAPVDFIKASAEFNITPQALEKAFQTRPELAALRTALKSGGTTREAFLEIFLRVVEKIELGKATGSFRLTASVTEQKESTNAPDASKAATVQPVKVYRPSDQIEFDANGDTKLHRLVDSGTASLAEISEAILEVPINTLNKKGLTPLATAAFNEKQELIEFLISKGADINAPLYSSKFDMLEFLEFHHKHKIVPFFRNLGMKYKLRAENKTTLYEVAILDKSEDLAQRIFNDLQTVKVNDPPLSFALKEHRTELFKFFLSKGATVSFDDLKSASSEEILALSAGGLESLHKYVMKDAKLKNDLIFSASVGKMDAVLKTMTSAETKDLMEYTDAVDAFSSAISDGGGTARIEVYLRHGFDPNLYLLRSFGRMTPLHVVVKSFLDQDDYIERLELLISYGAKTNIINDDEETAYDMAIDRLKRYKSANAQARLKEIVALLKKYPH